ncbi:n-acetylmuramoyl-l-alanine amidase [Lucifera butyrica]|uniref:N-acetylmuramoyl-l-alanine amidase n=1 Tax=Lucifera butyrica TaxID=1351585 RepID=A0A498RAY0_9FIRM|nr:N-acetylmuramoyl-L-alanine amidase [Lucifera butyrica]VBB09896.1 n-acetylmuramoyl-l-alanine amidase [Lucifera butyrica]
MTVLYVPKRRLVFGLLPVLLLGLFAAYSTLASQPLSGKLILVDAGHGGVDSGANQSGIQEKNINLAFALALKEALQRQGANVVLSRDQDMELSGQCDNPRVKGRYRRDLAARLEMVTESAADLFISIHANASPDTRRQGVDTYYNPKSASGKALAHSIQEELKKVTVASEKEAPGNYFVLRRNTVPAALIEVGYITHAAERNLLQSPEYRARLVEAIVKGICSFYQSL